MEMANKAEMMGRTDKVAEVGKANRDLEVANTIVVEDKEGREQREEGKHMPFVEQGNYSCRSGRRARRGQRQRLLR